MTRWHWLKGNMVRFCGGVTLIPKMLIIMMMNIIIIIMIYYHDDYDDDMWWHSETSFQTKFLPTPPTIAIISKLGISSFPIYRSQVRWLETTILTLPPRIIVQWKVGVSPIGSLHFEYPSIFHWSMILPSQILLPTSPPPRNHRIRPYDQGLSTIGFLNVLWCLFSSCPSTKNLNSWRSTPIATNAQMPQRGTTLVEHVSAVGALCCLKVVASH